MGSPRLIRIDTKVAGHSASAAPASDQAVARALSVPSTDADFVARIRAGDMGAFEALFFAYHNPLLRFARRFVQSPEVAEELVQDAFYRLWRNRSDGVVRTSVRAYLYTAVQNAAFNVNRHRQVVAKYAEVFEDGGPPGTIGTRSASADSATLAHELADVLQRAVKALPPRAQQAYTLRVEHDLSYAEVAETMDITIKAVERLITRANVMLQEALNAYQ